jgi:cobalt-zinc-cadmium efflux system protein
LLNPRVVDGAAVIAYAVVGLAANTVSIGLLQRAQKESLNVRGAFLEVVGDALGSLAVLVAAVVIAATGWERADPLASLLVGGLILPRAWHLLRAVLDVLMEATPDGVDLDEVRQHMLAAPGVYDVHDLHAWTITSGMPVLSAHVVVENDTLLEGCGGGVLDHLGACLAGHFDIEHSTFQLEPRGHREHEGVGHP